MQDLVFIEKPDMSKILMQILMWAFICKSFHEKNKNRVVKLI